MPGVDIVAGQIAAFAVTPEFLIMMMKHGINAARIVENPLPLDAKFVSAHVEHGLIWIIVQSDSLPYIGPLEMIPQFPSTVFMKVADTESEA